MMGNESALIPVDQIEDLIVQIRGRKVILDTQLARLYGVETKRLKEAVRRNMERFPEDFMFILSRQEFASLRSQFAASNTEGRGGTRYLPMAFTEQGVAMLSSVLNSIQAIQVNIEIMRAFVRLRQAFASHVELSHKIEEMEKKYDLQFKLVFDAIRKLVTHPETEHKEIGFRIKR